jgi:hypothetical protein
MCSLTLIVADTSSTAAKDSSASARSTSTTDSTFPCTVDASFVSTTVVLRVYRVRIRKVSHVVLTKLDWMRIGGLPGTFLGCEPSFIVVKSKLSRISLRSLLLSSTDNSCFVCLT